MLPHIRDQLKKLKTIPYSEAKRASAVIVDIPIGQLSDKDKGRVIYVVVNAFTELTHKQQVIVKVIHQAQEDMKKVLDDGSLTKEELISKIKEIAFNPVSSEEEHSSKSDSSSGTESSPPS